MYNIVGNLNLARLRVALPGIGQNWQLTSNVNKEKKIYIRKKMKGKFQIIEVLQSTELN